MYLRVLQLWLLDLVSHGRQAVGCHLASQDSLPVLEDLALASVHHHFLVVHQDLEGCLLALVDELDPQLDRVCLYSPRLKMLAHILQLDSPLLADLLALADPQALVDHLVSRAVVALPVLAGDRHVGSSHDNRVTSAIRLTLCAAR